VAGILDAFADLEARARQGAADLETQVEGEFDRTRRAVAMAPSVMQQNVRDVATTVTTAANGAVRTLTQPLQNIRDAAQSASDTLKWIIIGGLVLVGVALIAWIAWLYFQGRLALAILPKVAEGAAGVAGGAA